MFFYFQESVGDYLSQRFRNLRRPTDSIHKNDPKAKVVSSSLATPVVVNPIDVSVGPDPDSDMVAYERNTKVLLDEYANHPSNHSHILKLLEVTHLIRREKIQTSQLSIAQLQKEYPYFQNGKWVCIQIRMSVQIHIALCIMHFWLSN